MLCALTCVCARSVYRWRGCPSARGVCQDGGRRCCVRPLVDSSSAAHQLAQSPRLTSWFGGSGGVQEGKRRAVPRRAEESDAGEEAIRGRQGSMTWGDLFVVWTRCTRFGTLLRNLDLHFGTAACTVVCCTRSFGAWFLLSSASAQHHCQRHKSALTKPHRCNPPRLAGSCSPSSRSSCKDLGCKCHSTSFRVCECKLPHAIVTSVRVLLFVVVRASRKSSCFMRIQTFRLETQYHDEDAQEPCISRRPGALQTPRSRSSARPSRSPSPARPGTFW